MIDRRWLDRWWAEYVRCPPQQFRAGGVVVTDHLDHVGAFRTQHGDNTVVYGRAVLLEAAGLCGSEPCRSVDEALERWRGGLGAAISRVLGPAWYGYASRQTLREVDTSAVRQVQDSDRAQVEVLRRATPAGEWDEAGMSSGADVGYFAAGRAWVTNGASLAVARRVCVEPYGVGVVVDVS